MEEIFKDIEGYEGLYQISNFGRVKSLNYNHTKQERILKERKDGYGYLTVILSKDSKLKNFKVHRLVAQAFIPNPNNYPCVNHKDENKTNNCIDNLEWCTYSYNVNYGTRNEKLSIIQTNRKDQSKEIIQLDLEGNELNRFPSAYEIERQLGFNNANVSKCCNGKIQTAYKYKWRYA